MLESSLVYIITRTFPESIVVVLSGIILLGMDNIDKEESIKIWVCYGFYYKCYKIIAYKFWCTFNIINDSRWDDTFQILK